MTGGEGMADRGAAPAGDGRDASGRDRELDELAAKRMRMAGILTVLLLVVYFGFVLLMAVAKDARGELVWSGFSWGMLLGVIVILVTFAVTIVYVSWANRVYQPELNRLKERGAR